MTVEDLKNHMTTFEEPIKTEYKSHVVWEIPPNGQGITALMALNILEEFDLKGEPMFYICLSYFFKTIWSDCLARKRAGCFEFELSIWINLTPVDVLNNRLQFEKKWTLLYPCEESLQGGIFESLSWALVDLFVGPLFLSIWWYKFVCKGVYWGHLVGH